ncbi:hypothetical protein T11_4848 [Trichinella zimbabwensis]|uniref:Uncharacterized protein n=1 Tax=Trichinella zimbabwensis TaxID=268475 RepID=A0A0V1H940_9BILA|nr:hypothetical protein T11_4848 [Trichinella zimbabwensis]
MMGCCPISVAQLSSGSYYKAVTFNYKCNFLKVDYQSKFTPKMVLKCHWNQRPFMTVSDQLEYTFVHFYDIQLT